MIALDDPQRIARARLLRRQGKTYNEIREVIGPVDDKTLAKWLRGIARPPQTYRTRACRELARECRRLRGTGLTYDEIAALTGASTGSLSLWLRDMPIPRNDPRSLAHRNAAIQTTRAKSRERKLRARDELIAAAGQAIGPVTPRELFLVGIAIYWAEGVKSKPWAIRDRLTIINSDPSMILMFLRWLELLGVDRSQCRFHLQIHESADVAAAEQYWSNLVGVDLAMFNKTSLKRHNPKTVRKNVGEHYYGCLIVDVLNSARLFQMVAGWWNGLVNAGSA